MIGTSSVMSNPPRDNQHALRVLTHENVRILIILCGYSRSTPGDIPSAVARGSLNSNKFKPFRQMLNFCPYRALVLISLFRYAWRGYRHSRTVAGDWSRIVILKTNHYTSSESTIVSVKCIVNTQLRRSDLHFYAHHC